MGMSRRPLTKCLSLCRHDRDVERLQKSQSGPMKNRMDCESHNGPLGEPNSDSA